MIQPLCKAFLLSLLCLSLLAHSQTSPAESIAQTLYLLGYDIPIDERDGVVAEDIKALRDYQQKRINSTWLNKFEDDAPTTKLSSYDYIHTRDLQLCPIKNILDCVAKLKQDPAPYEQSMQQLAPVLRDISRLKQADSDELTTIYPKDLQLPNTSIPNYRLLSQPIITQSVLAFQNDPNQSIPTLCENIAVSKKLIVSQDNLIQSMVGKYMLDSHLELLAQTSAPLPSSCVDALAPMTTHEVDICPLVQADARQEANYLAGIANIPIIYSREATINQVYREVGYVCNDDWQTKITNDEPAQYSIDDIYAPKLFNQLGGKLINIANNDYGYYQNRLQDTNAQLRLWQEAMDPQCTTASAYYITAIANDWHPKRNLRLNNTHQIIVDLYDQPDYSQVNVSCRAVQ